MALLLPIFRLLHFLGFSLLLGGLIASLVLVKKEGKTARGIELAHTCIHALAAPGLVVLLLSGILHSSVVNWAHFRGAGYMHGKILFVVGIFVLMIVDIRTQKTILKKNPPADVVIALVNKRQTIALIMASLTLVIMWLISFRPF